MRKLLLLCCLAALPLAGCHTAYENPYRVDTVVRIPVDPTQPPTEPIAAEFIPAETEPEAREAPKKTTGSGKTSGGSSGKSSSGKNKTTTKATEPPATQPPTEAPTELPFIPSEYTPGIREYEVLDLINSHRTSEGLAELTMDASLCEMAAVRSNEAAQSWSHIRPDGRGFETVLTDYEYSCSVAAENMIYTTGETDARTLVDKWMNADSHRANILSGDFTAVGVGLYHTGGITYITVLFAG